MTTLDDLRAISEELRTIEQARERIRSKRDKAIRDIRRSTDHTVPEIAAAADVSQATVKAVVRGLGRSELR